MCFIKKPKKKIKQLHCRSSPWCGASCPPHMNPPDDLCSGSAWQSSLRFIPVINGLLRTLCLHSLFVSRLFNDVIKCARSQRRRTPGKKYLLRLCISSVPEIPGFHPESWSLAAGFCLHFSAKCCASRARPRHSIAVLNNEARSQKLKH